MNTAAQENIFIEVFYDLWIEEGFDDTDISSPYPWGCPWLEDKTFAIDSDAAKHAEEYFAEMKGEIAHYLCEEAEH